MTLCSRTRLFPLLGAVALLVVLASGSETPAQKKNKKGQPVPSAGQLQKAMTRPKGPAVSPVAKLQEAAVLRNAYILMAAANHNYHGHRGKAMKAIERAVTKLDKGAAAQGNLGQKVLARQNEIQVEVAKFRARHAGKVHTPQAWSDLQVQEAGRLLVRLRPVLAAN